MGTTNEDCKDWPSKYSGREDANDGDDMWEKLVSQHKNICLVLSGHIGYPDLVTRYDTGANGKKAYLRCYVIPSIWTAL